MKHMTCGIVFLLVALATPVIYGGEPARGVAGVDVIVKQRPSDRAVTDARGNFAMEALAAGSYTLTFRARKAEDLHHSTSDKVIVATLYSIKIDGTKRAVNKSGLTTNDLLAGVRCRCRSRTGREDPRTSRGGCLEEHGLDTEGTRHQYPGALGGGRLGGSQGRSPSQFVSAERGGSAADTAIARGSISWRNW